MTKGTLHHLAVVLSTLQRAHVNLAADQPREALEGDDALQEDHLAAISRRTFDDSPAKLEKNTHTTNQLLESINAVCLSPMDGGHFGVLCLFICFLYGSAV